ncbi:MAG: hypothetical protein FJW39_11090 [Acidobacteria bacterium]|nr:hypothetical protein [Acidobacteriota bacterium]
MRAPWLLLAAAPLLTQSPLAQSISPRDLGPGRFLIATRGLTDPNFAETVVLLASHGKDGAMGLIINRPTPIPIEKAFDAEPKARGRKDSVLEGGPVQPNAVFALVRSATPPPGSKPVFTHVHLVNTRESFRQVLGTDADRLRVFAGYSGWAPGQLEREVEAGAWAILMADANTVFDPDPEAIWPRLIRRTELRVAD